MTMNSLKYCKYNATFSQFITTKPLMSNWSIAEMKASDWLIPGPGPRWGRAGPRRARHRPRSRDHPWPSEARGRWRGRGGRDVSWCGRGSARGLCTPGIMIVMIIMMIVIMIVIITCTLVCNRILTSSTGQAMASCTVPPTIPARYTELRWYCDTNWWLWSWYCLKSKPI